jgi:hypothetical protein
LILLANIGFVSFGDPLKGEENWGSTKPRTLGKPTAPRRARIGANTSAGVAAVNTAKKQRRYRYARPAEELYNPKQPAPVRSFLQGIYGPSMVVAHACLHPTLAEARTFRRKRNDEAKVIRAQLQK